MISTAELRLKRGQIANDMHGMLGNIKTSEDQEKFERLDAEQGRLKVEIERQERVDALLTETSSRVPQPDPSGPAAKMGPEQRKEREDKYSKLYWKYMTRREEKSAPRDILSQEEMQFVSEYRATIGVEGTPGGGAYPGSTAGFVVPVGFISDVEVALKYFGPMLDGGPGMPRILVTETGGQLPFPTANDTTVTGELTAEAAGMNIADVSTGIINLQSYKFDSKIVKVSWEMLQDAGINIPDFLSNAFATRLGRILNTKFTVGAGTTEPNGIITAATSGGTAIGANDNDGASAANTIGSDDFTTLEHSVDPLYRRQAKYMMHDSTLAAIKKIKDKYGRPLWMISPREGQPDTINGYTYCINNDMAQLQTAASSPTVSNITLLFGNLSNYLIRRVRDITVVRLDELYAVNGQVGFVAFARYDGNLIDAGTHPVKYLTNTY